MQRNDSSIDPFQKGKMIVITIGNYFGLYLGMIYSAFCLAYMRKDPGYYKIHVRVENLIPFCHHSFQGDSEYQTTKTDHVPSPVVVFLE